MQKPTNAHGFLWKLKNNSKIHSCYLLQIQSVGGFLITVSDSSTPPFKRKVQLVEFMDINRGGTSVSALLYTM